MAATSTRRASARPRSRAERGYEYGKSFDKDLVLGVATYAHELFTAEPELDAVYVPIGLGSGICGVIGARDALGCKAHVFGVVSDRANTYRRRPGTRGDARRAAGPRATP